MIHLRPYSHSDLPRIRRILLDLHAGIPEYAPDDPFVQRFPWFVDHWGGRPGFTCVIGYDGNGGEPVGFAYGAPLETGREWWRGHLDPAPERSRTYAVSELMLRPKWRKTGASDALHQALLAERDEDLAVLLVDSGHPKVRERYEGWGYRRVGTQRPAVDAPVCDVMVKALRGSAWTGRS
ncbi:GNAT family N-acetyltransferase [Streptomyces sp. NPDC093109]|uniref:GNAT family N-acetyltransferase n=1 Tax=Streptomyces sp. NPDC093109 TaxID=3154977 RepID=UPI00344EDA57